MFQTLSINDGCIRKSGNRWRDPIILISCGGGNAIFVRYQFRYITWMLKPIDAWDEIF